MPPSNYSQNVISFYEYEAKALQKVKDKIKEAGIREIERLNHKMGAEVLKLLYRKVKASKYVGMMKVGPYTIQILPKIFSERRFVVNMSFKIFFVPVLSII